MIVAIETRDGRTMTVAEALDHLANGNYCATGMDQLVMGVWDDGRKTSLKPRKDGFYYMSGNYCSEAKR